MGNRLLEFGGIRLVINQSVIPVELESSPEDQSSLSAVCYLSGMTAGFASKEVRRRSRSVRACEGSADWSRDCGGKR